MAFCRKCGEQIMDEAVFCPKCGCSTGYKQKTTDSDTMKNIAKIFMIIGCAVSGLALIPLAWTLPMTLSYIRKIKNNEPISDGFKICSLIFVSIVAGVLMLCDSND